MSAEPTLDTLAGEFRTFTEGVRALAESLDRSDDMEELSLFLATVAEWRSALYNAEIPANTRLQELEIWERHNSLSWTLTS